MNADVLTTRVADGIAVVTLGSANRIYFDEEMGDAVTAALDGFAGDANVRVVVVTGGAPGYFIRHYSIAVLIRLAESLRASGREWPENATYNGGFLDKAIALCESMPKPVIAAISGTALAGGFEFALSCDLRIAEDGDYLIGFLEPHLGLVPGAGGTQRLPRTIGTPAALMHILMGDPLTPREAERKGLVHDMPRCGAAAQVPIQFWPFRLASAVVARGTMLESRMARVSTRSTDLRRGNLIGESPQR